MTRRKNTGLTIVEILISITIFAILMIPIVSSIISSLKMSTTAKETQYRNDYAEILMESVKSLGMNELSDSSYFENSGTLPGSFTYTYAPGGKKNVTLADGTTKEIEFGKYTITGQTKIGIKKETYSYQIELDNSYYAEKNANDSTYVDPNNLALGVVEDIDHTKVALIDGTILNYDTTATNALRTKKLQALKEKYPADYDALIDRDTGIDRFAVDTGRRLLLVEVSGSKSAGYDVKCTLNYADSNSLISGDNVVTYTPYAEHFSEGLPNIYLMYNPCFYNGGYQREDVIALDVSGVTDSGADIPEINLFVIETAATYARSIENSGAITDAEKGKVLYNNSVANGVSRDDVNVLFYHANRVGTSTDVMAKVGLYHNFGDNSETIVTVNPTTGVAEDTEVTKLNKKSEKFYYTDDDLSSFATSIAAGTMYSAIVNYLNDGVAVANKMSLEIFNDLNVGNLNEASQESRGLYQVKIWLQEGTSVDTTSDPILRGTKGGDES